MKKKESNKFEMTASWLWHLFRAREAMDVSDESTADRPVVDVRNKIRPLVKAHATSCDTNSGA